MSDDFQSTPPAPPTPPTPPVAPVGPPAGGDAPSDTGKIIAALGYLTGIAAIIGLLMEPYKDERLVKFHSIQALGFYVAMIVVNVILSVLSAVSGGILGLLWILVGPAMLVIAIVAALKAYKGEYWEMPVVYGVVKSYI